MDEHISRDRIIELGKKSIAQKGGDKAKQDSFARKMMKKFGSGMGSLIGATPTKCLVCGKPLKINNGNQVVKYCKGCRHLRHNKKGKARKYYARKIQSNKR